MHVLLWYSFFQWKLAGISFLSFFASIVNIIVLWLFSLFMSSINTN
jgi:hypothetical protein